MLSLYFVLFLSVLGLLNAGYLAIAGLLSVDACFLGHCSVVLSSQYSKLLGVPVAFLAVAYFATMIYGSIRGFCSKRDLVLETVVPRYLSGVAVLVSLAYLAIMQFVLKAFCGFCLTNHVIVILIAVILFAVYRLQGLGKMNGTHLKELVKGLGVGVLVSVFLYGYLMLGTVVLGEQQYGIYIQNEFIPLDQIDQSIKLDISQFEMNKLNKRRQIVANMLIEKEALAREISPEELVQIEISRGIQVSSEELDKALKIHQAQYPEKQWSRDEVRQFLTRERQYQAYEIFLEQLKKKYEVKELLPKPEKIFLKPNSIQQFFLGDPKAPLTVTMFSDLECPSCARAHDHLQEMMDKFPGQFKVEFRHFPLMMHKQSKNAAKASICAADQGKFEPYIHRLIENRMQLSDQFYESLAKELSLDIPRFKGCLDSKKTNDILEEDVRVSEQMGIRGTPTFVIDGDVYLGSVREAQLKQYLK